MIGSRTSRDIGKTILLAVGISGLIITAALFPGLGYALKELQKHKFKKYPTHRINQALRRLEKQELISISEVNGRVAIKLLEKGKQKIISYNLDNMKLKRGKWDGYWRVVIFDIPEEKKTARDFLRTKMKQLGFYILQESVLVTPWECRDEIDFIKHYYNVEKNVKLIIAKKFDEEEKVKSYFRL